MSCDYAVWNTGSRLSEPEAQKLYEQLCDGDTSGVTPLAAIDQFHKELTARYPEIDEVPEEEVQNPDRCPWSVAFDRSEGHIIMCCRWSKADYCQDLLASLALKYGLSFYDPQQSKLTQAAQQGKKWPWWRFW
jgi:hypothetical protein